MIFTDKNNNPKLVLDADGFVRASLYYESFENISSYCHVPVVINNENTNLDFLLKKLKGESDPNSDLPLEKDIVLIWSKTSKRIITGADIFGRLLKGI